MQLVWNNIMTELSFMDEILSIQISMWCISDIFHHKTGNSYDSDLFDWNSFLPLTKSSCCVSLRQIVYASHFMSICLQAARNRCHMVNYYQIEENKFWKSWNGMKKLLCQSVGVRYVGLLLWFLKAGKSAFAKIYTVSRNYMSIMFYEGIFPWCV